MVLVVVEVAGAGLVVGVVVGSGTALVRARREDRRRIWVMGRCIFVIGLVV